jgi:hypothetical protein
MVEPSRSAPVKRLLNCVRTDLPCVSLREQPACLENFLQEVSAGQPRVVLLPTGADIGETQSQELRSGTLCRGSEVGSGHCPQVLALPNPPAVEIFQAPLHQPSRTIKRTLSTAWLDRRVLHSGAELAHRRDQQMKSCRTHDQPGVKACRLAIGDHSRGQQGPALARYASSPQPRPRGTRGGMYGCGPKGGNPGCIGAIALRGGTPVGPG